MKIVLAGQLNRVYSNAVAFRASDSDGARNRDVRKARREKDRPLVHRALSLAALSYSIVTSQNLGVGDNDDHPALQRSQDPHFAPGMSLTPSLWADLYDDAAGLVKAVDFLGSYSEPALTVMNAIDATGAWIDDDGPRSLRRSKMGTTHTYLADLLLQAFLAWQAQAILVLCEADCHVLADIAKFLVEGNRPRPFPIPDLRAIVRRDGQSAFGKLPNLELECLEDVEEAREDRGVQNFSGRVRDRFEVSQLSDVTSLVSAALAAARSPGTRLQGTDDFAVSIADAKILGNEGVQVPLNKKALVRMSLRRFAAHDLRSIIFLD